MMKVLEFEKYKIIECKGFIKKFLGFMFKKKFDYGLLFNNCNSIHTFFMKKNIDVIFLDKDFKIVKRYNNVKKNKILICKNANKVIEIPSNH